MPQRQKILLIALAVVVAYYVYATFLSGDSAQSVQTTNEPATQQSTPERTTPAPSKPVAQNAGATQESVKLDSNFELAWENDPFMRTAVVAVSSQDATISTGFLDLLNYSGYIKRGGIPHAQINNNWYKINEQIDGMKIVKIDKKYVELEKNGMRFQLPFKR